MKDLSSIELSVIIFLAYLFALSLVTRIGKTRKCGWEKALFVSIFLTPVVGLIYVLLSRNKNLIKIVHYSCPKCGLEYTDGHKYCPLCSREGETTRLHKISMIAY